MLVYEDFQETSQIQATVFTPDFIFSTSEILKRLIDLEPDLFDGDPYVLPLPDNVPPEIPRITLQNRDKRYRLEVAPARVNFFRNKTKEEDKVIPTDFVQVAAKTLTSLLDEIGAKCSRIAAVINRFCYNDSPSREIAIHFCKDNFLKEPFDRPSEFELHSLKKYSFLDSFKVNSWVRIKSGQMKSKNDVLRSAVIVHQDINTISEESRTYTSEEIFFFYEKICNEFDEILRLYFPK